MDLEPAFSHVLSEGKEKQQVPKAVFKAKEAF